MKSDIEIAQEAELVHIKEVAEKLGINEDELEFYGKYKAKISDELWESVKDREDGKLVLVTAINPTPAGEGKTTTSIFRTVLWNQRWSCRWWICAGSSDGRFKSAFYRRFPCNYIRK